MSDSTPRLVKFKNDSKSRRITGVDKVFNAMCELGREYGTTPPQNHVAKHLGVSKQYVSYVMHIMSLAGIIEWLDRYTYRIVGAAWVPPDEIPLVTGNVVPQDERRPNPTRKLRFLVLERDNYTCRACGRNPRDHGVALHIDHITPLSQGGKTELDNLQILCEECNTAKGTDESRQMSMWGR
jgi:hypothetical protein